MLAKKVQFTHSTTFNLWQGEDGNKKFSYKIHIYNPVIQE